MIVPAVTEVCLPQPAHSQVHGLVCSSQALSPLLAVRADKALRPARRDEVLDAGCLVRKALLELDRERGKSVTAGPSDQNVRFMFYAPSLLLSLHFTLPDATG